MGLINGFGESAFPPSQGRYHRNAGGIKRKKRDETPVRGPSPVPIIAIGGQAKRLSRPDQLDIDVPARIPVPPRKSDLTGVRGKAPSALVARGRWSVEQSSWEAVQTPRWKNLPEI